MRTFIKLGTKRRLLGVALGLCLSQGSALFAAEPTPAPIAAKMPPGRISLDVAVTPAGEWSGSVLNPDASPAMNAHVMLRSASGKDTLQATTDAAGRFHLQGVRPGAYSLTVIGEKSRATKIVRVWPTGSAPPAAMSLAVIQLEPGQTRDVVRGQEPEAPMPRPVPEAVGDPFVTGGEGGFGGLFGGGFELGDLGVTALRGLALVGAGLGTAAFAMELSENHESTVVVQQAPASP
jgi:hypothetical protein